MKHGLIGWFKCFLLGYRFIGIKKEHGGNIQEFSCWNIETPIELDFCIRCGERKATIDQTLTNAGIELERN